MFFFNTTLYIGICEMNFENFEVLFSIFLSLKRNLKKFQRAPHQKKYNAIVVCLLVLFSTYHWKTLILDEATNTSTNGEADVDHLRSVVAAISVALCVSFFTIVLLLVLLYRRQQEKNQTQTVESRELQTTGETNDESEQSTRHMKMNSYRHVGSVLGRPLSENTNEPHFYQDVEDDSATDISKGTNTDELTQEGKTMSYEYQKLMFGEGESGLWKKLVGMWIN